MARINIENSLLQDERFFDLAMRLGSRQNAIGAMVWAFIIAQKFWLITDRGIPITEWEKQKINTSIIDVGLAKSDGEFVYICGSEKQFAWLKQRSDAGKSGGKATQSARREIIKQSGQSESSGRQSESSGREASFLLSPFSSSFSKEKEYILSDFEKALNEYKKLRGVTKGSKAIVRFKEQIKTTDEFESLLLSIRHYSEFLAARENNWRRPKTTFETFLGSRASGYFWHDFITAPERGAHLTAAGSWQPESNNETE